MGKSPHEYRILDAALNLQRIRTGLFYVEQDSDGIYRPRQIHKREQALWEKIFADQITEFSQLELQWRSMSSGPVEIITDKGIQQVQAEDRTFPTKEAALSRCVGGNVENNATQTQV